MRILSNFFVIIVDFALLVFALVLAFDFDLDLHLPIKLSHNGITEGKSELEWVSEVKDDIDPIHFFDE